MQTMRQLDAADARTLVDAAKVVSERIGVPMALAVLDAGGHALLVERMTGAGWLTPDLARSKAFTAAGWRTETATLQERLAAAPFLVTAIAVETGGRFMPQGGGVPVIVGGEVVGALGASGGTAAQDHEVVSGAVASFGLGN